MTTEEREAMTQDVRDIDHLRQLNPMWFGKGNSRFFGDVRYTLQWSAKGKPFLVRSTYAWSDMFGQPKKLHYRVNTIEPNGKVGKLIEQSFATLAQAKSFIRGQE